MLSNAWKRLTARERLLIQILAGMMLVSGAVWLMLLPGLDAVSAAESRRSRAAGELAYVQQLSAEVTGARTQAAGLDVTTAAPLIADTALEFGLQLLTSTIEGGDLKVEVDAPGSARLLEWVDAASARAAMGVRAIHLRRGEAGALLATVHFSRSSP